MTTPLQVLVERADVEARLGETLAEPETTQVDSLIAFASSKVRSKVGTIDARIVAGTLDPELVKGTLVTVVCRALDTMRIGLRVRSEQYPEIQTTYADASPELIEFTEGELETLSPDSGKTGGAFTIRAVGSR